MFYLDDSNIIQEWNDDPSNAPTGNGSISAKGWKVGATSRLAAYWPNILYQDDSDVFHHIGINDNGWAEDAAKLGKVAMFKHTGLVVVPRDQSNTAVEAIYQRSDRKIGVYKSALKSPGNWSYG